MGVLCGCTCMCGYVCVRVYTQTDIYIYTNTYQGGQVNAAEVQRGVNLAVFVTDEGIGVDDDGALFRFVGWCCVFFWW
jgi:hypothetical protein